LVFIIEIIVVITLLAIIGTGTIIGGIRINKINKEAEKMLKQEEKQIPNDIDYNEVPNLASEARQKLMKVNPTTIGQALRISGVNPSDISILMIYLRKKYNE